VEGEEVVFHKAEVEYNSYAFGEFCTRDFANAKEDPLQSSMYCPGDSNTVDPADASGDFVSPVSSISTGGPPPLPVRALQARLKSKAGPPSWAAYLPASLEKMQEAMESTEKMQEAMESTETMEEPLEATASDLQAVGYMLAYYDGVNYYPVTFANSEWPDHGDYNAYGIVPQLESGEACMYYPDQQLDRAGAWIHTDKTVWQLATDKDGTRIVQQALDDAATDQDRLDIFVHFIGHVWEALKCPHANYVLAKCVQTISPQHSQFVIEELIKKGAPTAARHRYGCRILQRLLEHCNLQCNGEQLHQLIEALLDDAVALSSHIYGNYVIQHLFEYGDSSVGQRLVHILEQNLQSLPLDGYAGSVLEKALTCSSTQDCRQSLVALLVADHDGLCALACSRFGHAAAEKVLHLAQIADRKSACEYLDWYKHRLRWCRYGKKIAKVAEEQLH
jgi:hypothetical protein